MVAKRNYSNLWTVLSIAVTLYVVLAYLLLPVLWKGYLARHPALRNLPFITSTSDGHPGDPLNIGLAGDREELERIMRAAGWLPADPLGVQSDLKIAEATVLDRPYPQAPVSDLFLWGRKEDLAFEQPVGDNPRQRHHVRFWKSEQRDEQGQPLWAGSVTYDKSVGLSHTTGQITHHIDGDLDAERDRLLHQLEQTGQLLEVQYLNDFQQHRTGFNGGGDPWHTDGRLALGRIRK